MAKNQPKINDPYHIRLRTYNNVNEPGHWQCNGTGEWQGIETVQKQIRLLKSAFPSHKVEIEFTYKGELRDYNGNITGQSIILERR